LVNGLLKERRYLWTLVPCAAVLCLAALLRGAEYDEQYTLFLTAGVPRPDWPAEVFPAGLAHELQSGTAGLATIARDLRITDVHPPLYFWLVSLWRATFGHDLIVARMLSVVLGLNALALIGAIALLSRLPPARAMLLTLGCYGFTYTSVVARGFALAQLLLLAGVLCLLVGRRRRHFLLAGALFGAATLTNYLAVFAAGACLLAAGLEAAWPQIFRPSTWVTSPGFRGRFPPLWRGYPRYPPRYPQVHPQPGACIVPPSHRAFATLLGFLAFIPGDLWWFLGQSGSRPGQFPPFHLGQSLARLTARFAGDILGGLPLYVPAAASPIAAAALGLLLIWLVARIVRHWGHIGIPHARTMFALAALAPPFGLLVLGALFNNTPIEVRYLTFSTPFVGLLLAGALGSRGTAAVLAIQAASIAGLMLAPQTMQPARAAAHAAAMLVGDGVVLLPRGNDGVGIVGAFAIEAPPALPLLLIRTADSPDQIRASIRPWHRVVLALVEQDDASRAATRAMHLALADPGWREVARGPYVAVYERVGETE